jgi:hypothetical protein
MENENILFPITLLKGYKEQCPKCKQTDCTGCIRDSGEIGDLYLN